MLETSNNFDHSKHLNYVIAPEAPTTTGGMPSPENHENKKKMSLKNKLLLGGAGVALAAVAATGIGISVSAKGEKAPEATSTSAPANPTTEPSVVPSASATPEAPATTPDRYDYGITEASVAGLMSEDLQTFNNRPLAERAPLALYYAQDLPKFAKDWQSVSHNALDAVPAEINANNKPQEILSVIAMSHRQPFVITQADGFHFDKPAADKLIDSLLVNGSLSQAYKSLTEFSTALDTPRAAPSARSLPASGYLEMPKLNSSSAKYTDAAGYTCIDLNVTETPNSTTTTYDMTACLVTVDKGSLWMER